MASGAKSFVINRKSDWEDESVITNLSFFKDTLISKNNGENGVYISSPFDSGQEGTVWHRLRMDMDLPSGGMVHTRLYASDDFEAFVPSNEGKKRVQIDVDKYIHSPDIDINRKIDMLDCIGAKKYENTDDMLLFDLQGRYLWMCIELVNYERQRICIRSVKLEFPRISFVDYLPDVYKEGCDDNSFLARFLGVFQSIYVDLEDKIDNTIIKFDTEKTDKDFLNWIADWISVKNPSIWGEAKLRTLVKEAVSIYKMKGTKASIAKIVKEYAGIEPIIVEKFNVEDNEYYQINKHQVENLFGDNGYVFTVILEDKYVANTEEYIELLRVIADVMPIDAICNLVVLNDKIYLDHHCYMGMNSYIAQSKELIIGEKDPDPTALILVDPDGG